MGTSWAGSVVVLGAVSYISVRGRHAEHVEVVVAVAATANCLLCGAVLGESGMAAEDVIANAILRPIIAIAIEPPRYSVRAKIDSIYATLAPCPRRTSCPPARSPNRRLNPFSIPRRQSTVRAVHRW